MKLTLQNFSLAFAAGCLGGLANAVFLWLFGVIGLTTTLGVQLAPALPLPGCISAWSGAAFGAGSFSCR